MQAKSHPVSSNQDGLHPRLLELVDRHQRHDSRKPMSDHTKEAFAVLEGWLNDAQKPLLLDAGCGVGDSTRALAKHYPDLLVVGVDQSADRLGRERTEGLPRNARLLRADLAQLWPLMAQAGMRPVRQTILYPNPWPKAAHIGRRWYAMPCFPSILACGGQLEVRTNWHLYAQEFEHALMHLGYRPRLTQLELFDAESALTAFERKYQASGHDLWSLECDLSAKKPATEGG